MEGDEDKSKMNEVSGLRDKYRPIRKCQEIWFKGEKDEEAHV